MCFTDIIHLIQSKENDKFVLKPDISLDYDDSHLKLQIAEIITTIIAPNTQPIQHLTQAIFFLSTHTTSLVSSHNHAMNDECKFIFGNH